MDRRYFSHGGNEPVLLFITSASILAEIQRIVSNEDEWRVRAKRWTCFLANLEKQGKRVDIFTQNIDGLHKKREASMCMNCMVPFKQLHVHHAGQHTNCLIYYKKRYRFVSGFHQTAVHVDEYLKQMLSFWGHGEAL